jgi:hypothetical protein
MRSRIFPWLIALLFFFAGPANAQLGIKFGASVSDIVFADDGTAAFLGYEADFMDHRLPYLSVQGGLFGTFELSKRLDLQPELLFVRRGLDYSSEYLYDDIFYRIKIHYLHVPVLLQYQLNEKKNGRSALYTGPYVSWKLQAQRITEIEGKRVEEEMSSVKDTDWGFTFGYATGFELPGGQLSAELRTSYSLSDMMSPVEGYIPEFQQPKRERARNVSITLMVGYRFDNLRTKEP